MLPKSASAAVLGPEVYRLPFGITGKVALTVAL